MRESFVFYRSFFEAILNLDDKKRLKMYDLIANFALNSVEIDAKYEICQQLFTLIKPQLVASHKHYEDGKKGGRPKKIKNPPFENKKSNENVNVNVNENVNVNVNGTGFSKPDPLTTKTTKIFIEEYQKLFNAKPFLSWNDQVRISELSVQYPDFIEIIPTALSRLKNIEFKDIDFNPSASWLLKSNNFERVMNGEFVKNNFDVSSAIEAWVKGEK